MGCLTGRRIYNAVHRTRRHCRLGRLIYPASPVRTHSIVSRVNCRERPNAAPKKRRATWRQSTLRMSARRAPYKKVGRKGRPPVDNGPITKSLPLIGVQRQSSGVYRRRWHRRRCMARSTFSMALFDVQFRYFFAEPVVCWAEGRRRRRLPNVARLYGRKYTYPRVYRGTRACCIDTAFCSH